MFDPADSPLEIPKSPARVILGWLAVAIALGFFLGFHMPQVMP